MKLESAPVKVKPAEHVEHTHTADTVSAKDEHMDDIDVVAPPERAATAADVFTSGAAFDCIFAYSGHLNYLFFALVCKSWRNLYNGRAAPEAAAVAAVAAVAAMVDADKTSARSTLIINALMSVSKLQMALENGLDLAASAGSKTLKLAGKYCPLEVLLYAHERGLQWSRDLNRRAARAGTYMHLLKHHMQCSFTRHSETVVVSYVRCFPQSSITSFAQTVLCCS
jgi:hypothetical protein